MPQEYRHSSPNGLPNYNIQGYLLYILPAPLFIKLVLNLLSPNIMKLLLTAAALFFFYSAAHLTRTTLLRLQNQPPYRPKKIKDNRTWAAVYVTVGVLILMLMMRRPPLLWGVMGASAFIGYYLLYGLTEKFVEPQEKYSNMPKATREAIEAAYNDLQHIETLSKQLDSPVDKPLFDSLQKVIEQSYIIMDLLVKALNEVEHAFRVKKSQLLDDDIFKLDIQLEVLDEQIKQED